MTHLDHRHNPNGSGRPQDGNRSGRPGIPPGLDDRDGPNNGNGPANPVAPNDLNGANNGSGSDNPAALGSPSDIESPSALDKPIGPEVPATPGKRNRPNNRNSPHNPSAPDSPTRPEAAPDPPGPPHPVAKTPHRALADVLHSMITDPSVVDEVVAAARTSPEVARLPVAENRRHVRVLLAAGLTTFERAYEGAGASGDRGEPVEEDPRAALLGADRAVQGVPLTGLLRGVQAGRRRALEIGVARGRSAGVPDAVLLDAMLHFDRHASAMERQVIEGYHTAELELARTARDARTQVLRRLLHGDPAVHPGAEEVLGAGLHPDVRYHCVLSDVAGPVQAHALERRLTVPGGLFGLVDGRLAGLTPRLPAQLDPDGPLLVVSPALTLAEVPAVYPLCERALRAADAAGLRGPHHLTDLAAETALAAQPDLARLLADRLLGALDPADGFHRELALTALAYLDHDRRLDRTAAALHVHPNTVRYRLAKLARATGAALDPPAPAGPDGGAPATGPAAGSAVPGTLRWWWALRTWLEG
ncbi:PucR family transcriptional regulator [Actinacidiphila acididurans]|nr:helix-turn-helix domain-containing protein [Actinacidiphila acididurans]